MPGTCRRVAATLPVALACLTCLGLAAPFAAGDKSKPPALDPALPYTAQRSDPIVYDVDFSAVVTPPYQCKLLKVWLPIPQSDAGQEVESQEISTFPMEVKPKIGTEPAFGNQFAYFEFANPQGAQVVRHKFKVKVWELRWGVDPAKVEPAAEWPAGFKNYLRSERGIVVNDKFHRLVKEIVPEVQNPARDLEKIMAWVNQNLKYDHDNASLEGSSEHALEKKAGHCSDYHGLCAAMGRALGYPTRITYGIHPFPKNSPSHCKLEAFIPPYGWVSFDVSETQRLIERIRSDAGLDAAKKEKLIQRANERLFRGFRDNTWFVQTKGSDYDLAPPAARKVNVVRTIYAEADGIALPEPDPAARGKREFSWMTVHKYRPDKPAPYPFQDWRTLEKK